ncbi:MAG: hypothetical protein ABGY75_07140 [Gemmataceae bacterium]
MIGELAIGLTAGGLALGTGDAGWREVRRRGMNRWLLPYLLSTHKRRAVRPGEPVDLILAVCDHYEPKRGGASMDKARARVRQWVDEYPRLFDRFRDAEGKPPQYSFFYPADEYEPELVDMVAGLCRRGYGEVEIHLHHDNDTADGLRNTLLEFKHTLRNRHGLLGTDSRTGEVVYGFIHGNWALDNARCDGRWCGVNNELDVLRETGCYADFTLPSAPSETQTRKINSIYWAVDDPAKPKSHDSGTDVGVGDTPKNGLLMIQGPLLMNWTRRKWGILPGVENSCLQANQPPDTVRLANWLKARVGVPSHPNWHFVKLHTHGVWEPNQDVLLGEPMVRFYEALQERSVADPNFRVHYVTAREMANLALAPSGVALPTQAVRNSPYSAPAE